ncbi:MAG: hypothetical protein SWH68_07035 [Thermodesulfobacteriota bacterium]|nr:hypothetical protein [Thermodesulfobacteriota bacterium]
MNTRALFCLRENDNMTLGAMITSGVDIWLNTPEPPMAAARN